MEKMETVSLVPSNSESNVSVSTETRQNVGELKMKKCITDLLEDLVAKIVASHVEYKNVGCVNKLVECFDDEVNCDPYPDEFEGLVEYGFGLLGEDMYSSHFEGGYNDH